MDKAYVVKMAGINRKHMDHILAGRRRPSSGLALRLEQITGIDRRVWVWGTTDEMREQLEYFFAHGKVEPESVPS